MTDEQLQEVIRDFQTIFLSEMLIESERLALAMETYIATQRRAGMSLANIRQALVNDAKIGGQIFGNFKAQFKARVWGVSEQLSDEILHQEQDARGYQLYQWVAIADMHTCADCADRATWDAMTWEEWEKVGLPGVGATLCGNRCRCDLIATGVFENDVAREASARYYQERYNAEHAGQITLDEARANVGGNLK